jgi:CHASE2 domain-containing sensor protein
MSWFDRHFIANWRDSWSWLSVRLAAAMGAIVTAVVSQPDLLLGILAFIPTDPVTRAFMAVGVGVMVFAGPWLARVWSEGGRNEPPAA